MNDFEEVIAATGVDGGLCAEDIRTIQVNVGLVCNLSCTHCHLECGPKRTESMGMDVMDRVVEIAREVRPGLVDITGGSPEMNPHLKYFIERVAGERIPVQVRTNFTAMLEDEEKDYPGFFRRHGVALVGSLPCYLVENVCAQRGEGVYERSVEAIRRLNAFGYGREGGPALDLVYNPGGAYLPGSQSSLEGDYKRELSRRFGVEFSRLVTITNMPIGRFRRKLERERRAKDYAELLRRSFNPGTVEHLMCRHQVSVGWDGTIYDCDFNLALGMAVNHGAPDHVHRFSTEELSRRRIVTGTHCFGCTAGCGSSCTGILA